MNVTSEQAKRLLSTNIDSILEKKGWSRYRLAKESGISEQTIRNIMSELHEPRLSIVATLANALGVTTNRLLHGHQENSEKCLVRSA